MPRADGALFLLSTYKIFTPMKAFEDFKALPYTNKIVSREVYNSGESGLLLASVFRIERIYYERTVLEYENLS